MSSGVGQHGFVSLHVSFAFDLGENWILISVHAANIV